MNTGQLYVSGQVQNVMLSAEQAAKLPGGSHAIFISHQNNDKQTAVDLARRISSAGRPCYVDVMDPFIDGDSPQLEKYLRQVIGNCSALLAVVSHNTVTSWWVPLEIGVALDREKHIGTYRITKENLPSYLYQWPIMDSTDQAVAWAKATNNRTAEFTHLLWRQRRNNPATFFNAL